MAGLNLKNRNGNCIRCGAKEIPWLGEVPIQFVHQILAAISRYTIKIQHQIDKSIRSKSLLSLSLSLSLSDAKFTSCDHFISSHAHPLSSRLYVRRFLRALEGEKWEGPTEKGIPVSIMSDYSDSKCLLILPRWTKKGHCIVTILEEGEFV